MSELMSVRLTGNIESQLEQFAEEVEERALRAGGGAAINVLHEEMSLRAPEGKTGNLRSSIYRWRDKARSIGGHQVYLVGPRKRKAPHWHLIEFGHWQRYVVKLIKGRFVTFKNQPLATPKWIPAKPYIRPTYTAKINQALDAGKHRIGEVVKEIVNGN